MAEEPEDEGANRVSEESRAYGLEDRTFAFAREVRDLVKRLPRTLCNAEDAKQLVRASGSVGANFIEAAESISSKDFVFRTRICRKEAKESRYCLRLLHIEDSALETQRQALINEARELVLIFNTIANKHRSA